MDRRIVKAANEGNVYAMLSLAYMYHHGVEVDIDADKALLWYKRSSSKGCGRAKWELSKMYLVGDLVERNVYEYIHWLTAAAESGIPEAMMDLSRMYYYGHFVPKDQFQSIDWLQKAADLEYPEGEFYLGYAYQNGIIVEKNMKMATHYMNRVWTHGDADYFYDVAQRLEFGLRGVKPDLNTATGWYQLAADMGSDKALYCLYRIGKVLEGQPQDTVEERQRRIAKLPSSEEVLARDKPLEEADVYMDEGEFDLALEKYNEAADRGNGEAMYMLAMLYHNGELVRRNDTLAYDFLGRAALSGCADAQLEIGRCYENGSGRPKDLAEAQNYYAMAVANGNLIGYFELSRFMEHPEKFVRTTQKVMR